MVPVSCLYHMIPSSEVISIVDDVGNEMWRGSAWALRGQEKYKNMKIVYLIAQDEGIIEVNLC